MATAPTYSDYAARFALDPALLSDDEDVQAALALRLAFQWTEHSAWADARRTEAALLLAAHERQLGLDRASGDRKRGRSTSSKTAGSWSRSSDAVSGMGADAGVYAQTDWGQAYLALRAQIRRVPMMGGMPR